MPSRPYVYQLPKASRPLDLSDLRSEMKEANTKREEAYDTSRKLQAEIIKAKTSLESSDESPIEYQELEQLVIDTVGHKSDRSRREANLSSRVEDFIQYKAFCHFLETGSLLDPSATPYATDEEYLGGACMGLAKDLARYGLGRATARDAESVSVAKNLVQEILEYLLQFDFRNGPLRRRYDGTKYSLKSLETLLYEVAVTGTSVDNGGGDGEPAEKRHKPNNDSATSSLMANEELKALHGRMEHRDNLRESLIKACRDGQKAAKQAIYALHRGDAKKAKGLLDQCESLVQKTLLPIVNEEAPLREGGSFGNLMEEYAEANFFFAWLYGSTTELPENPKTMSPPAVLLFPNEFAPLELDSAEYLGGICDLTGEIGRFAVQRATSRDEAGVKLCLQTNKSILIALDTIEHTPKHLNRKMGPLRQSVEKLERILYEMSLSNAAGGRNVQTHSMEVEPESKGGAMDEE